MLYIGKKPGLWKSNGINFSAVAGIEPALSCLIVQLFITSGQRDNLQTYVCMGAAMCAEMLELCFRMLHHL